MVKIPMSVLQAEILPFVPELAFWWRKVRGWGEGRARLALPLSGTHFRWQGQRPYLSCDLAQSEPVRLMFGGRSGRCRGPRGARRAACGLEAGDKGPDHVALWWHFVFCSCEVPCGEAVGTAFDLDLNGPPGRGPGRRGRVSVRHHGVPGWPDQRVPVQGGGGKVAIVSPLGTRGRSATCRAAGRPEAPRAAQV